MKLQIVYIVRVCVKLWGRVFTAVHNQYSKSHAIWLDEKVKLSQNVTWSFVKKQKQDKHTMQEVLLISGI
jgi:hypothetical protein